jgi:hypothetical protein
MIGSKSYATNEVKLVAADGASREVFGGAVSISGNVALVGANEDDDNGSISGSAYIFRYNGSNWVQEDKLLAADGATDDRFGLSVSISGDVALVGADGDDDNGSNSGSAYIFRYNGSSWVQEDKLLPSDGASVDNFGTSVSISGDVALVGANYNDDNGSAYIFRYNGSNWVQEDKLRAADGAFNDRFGIRVSISGDVALVGANYDGNAVGSAYIFRYNGSSWVQEQKLVASDGSANDQFGIRVSISGDAALVGANYNDDNGSAYIFRYNGSSWVQEDKLRAADGATDDFFGTSVSISGDVALVGAYGDDDNGESSGSAYIFRYNGSSWVQEDKLLAADGAVFDWFGRSVSISGDVALVGSPFDDDNGSNSGSAYVFAFKSKGNAILWIHLLLLGE